MHAHISPMSLIDLPSGRFSLIFFGFHTKRPAKRTSYKVQVKIQAATHSWVLLSDIPQHLQYNTAPSISATDPEAAKQRIQATTGGNRPWWLPAWHLAQDIGDASQMPLVLLAGPLITL
jgi:hypothetical protein